MRQALRLFSLGLLMAGCAQFPQLDAVVSEEAKRADYPGLIPAGDLLGKRGDGRLTESSGAELLARAQRLKARAAIIRKIQSVDEETRLRIAGRLRRLGG